MSLIEQRKKRYEGFVNRRAKNPPKYGNASDLPLPNVIFLEIFLFLKTQDIYQHVAFTCKKFHEITNSEEIVLELFMRRVRFGKDYSKVLLSKEDLISEKSKDYLIRNGGKLKSCYKRIWKYRKARLEDFKDFNSNTLVDIKEDKKLILEGEILEKRLSEFFNPPKNRSIQGCWGIENALRMRFYWNKKVLSIPKFVMEEISWGQCPYSMESRWFNYLDMPTENSLVLRFYYSWTGKNEFVVYFEKEEGSDNFILKRFVTGDEEENMFHWITEDSLIKNADDQIASICFVFDWCMQMVHNKNIFNTDERSAGLSQEIQLLEEFDGRKEKKDESKTSEEDNEN